MEVFLKEKNKNISSNRCHGIINWILQIFVWLLLILIIVLKAAFENAIYFEKLFKIALLSYGLIALVYYVKNIFLEEILSILFFVKKHKILREQLRDLIKQKPIISFKIECFHHKNKNKNKFNTSMDSEDESGLFNTSKDAVGIKIQKSDKKITFAEEQNFEYFTSRDISGPLILNNNNKKYYFVNLNFSYEIQFADALTVYEYERKKQLYKENNCWKDAEMILKEHKKLKNQIERKIFKISEEKIPNKLHWGVYVFFLIIQMIELYKIYVKKFITNENYTIKKIISTKYKLNSKKLEQFNPKIVLYDNQINFDKNDIIKKNKNFKFVEPTKEEIIDSKKYEPYVVEFDFLGVKRLDTATSGRETTLIIVDRKSNETITETDNNNSNKDNNNTLNNTDNNNTKNNKDDNIKINNNIDNNINEALIEK